MILPGRAQGAHKQDGKVQAAGRRQPRASLELRVIYEDDAVVAVDKPAGLTAVPVEGTGMPSAFALVAEEMKRQRQRAYVVHRIDRFTSGVMLFAKTDRDRDALVKQFLSHTPSGSIWPWFEDVLRTIRKRCWSTIFAVKAMFQRLTTAGDYQGTRAELRYSLERRLRGASLLRVTLVTGLQNQIRVQFAALGHPVIGDRKYSRKKHQSGALIALLCMPCILVLLIRVRESKSQSILSRRRILSRW